MHAAPITNASLHPIFRDALAGFSGQATRIRHDAYVRALKAHDWSHPMSDDHQKYVAGRESLAQLKLVQRELDPTHATWNEHCHPQCKDGKAYA